MLPIGTRIRRTGCPPDPYDSMKGTVVWHDFNERSRSLENPRPLRYNLVTFDNYPDRRVSWVEGHAGIVPLDAIDLLANLATDAG